VKVNVIIRNEMGAIVRRQADRVLWEKTVKEL
jgi:hypothetical protein